MAVQRTIVFFLSTALPAVLLSLGNAYAQDGDTLYLQYSFLKVPDEQESVRQEFEDFIAPIHQRRVASGEILGWDLWSLQPDGSDQGYQYLAATIFDDLVTMMEGSVDWTEYAQEAHPEMSDEEIQAMFDQADRARDIGRVYYLERIAVTDTAFELQPGVLAQIDFMKAQRFGSAAYEEAEMEIFQPLHQAQVDDGSKEGWHLLRVIHPTGTDVPWSHVTVNFFSGYEQRFGSGQLLPGETLDFAEARRIQDGLETRRLRRSYLATLERQVN